MESRLRQQQLQSDEDSKWLRQEERKLRINNNGSSGNNQDVPENPSEVVVKEINPTPTANLDRTNDSAYEATTSVVRAVMLLSQSVQKRASEQYLDLVKSIGVELRALLATVDALMPAFPAETHRQVRLMIEGPFALL